MPIVLLNAARVRQGGINTREPYHGTQLLIYAFAVLYFTGSKAFNVLMRSRALSLGYTLNEHGFHKMNGKKKGKKLNIIFHSEESIFKFLRMVYKTPHQRIDGRAVQES